MSDTLNGFLNDELKRVHDELVDQIRFNHELLVRAEKAEKERDDLAKALSFAADNQDLINKANNDGFRKVVQENTQLRAIREKERENFAAKLLDIIGEPDTDLEKMVKDQQEEIALLKADRLRAEKAEAK